MTLRSRPSLVNLKSRPEMDVATWLDWRQEVWRRDQGFLGSDKGVLCGEQRLVATWNFGVAT